MNATLPIRLRLGAVLTAALLLPACAATTPHWDAARFGDSVRAITAAQVADPAAVRNPNPVNGIDGRAASAAHAHYERSFAQPPAADGASSLLGAK